MASWKKIHKRWSIILVLNAVMVTRDGSKAQAFTQLSSASSQRMAMKHDRDDPKLRRHCQLEKSPSYNSVLTKRMMSGGGASSTPPSLSSKLERFQALIQKNFFLFGMFAALLCARLAPSLGRNGGLLRPELFVGKFGVTFIFFLSGLSLKVGDLADAFSNLPLNFLTQAVTFLAWPFLIGLPVTTAIRTFAPGLLPATLLDGLLVLSCLPTTVNMCVILTSAAGGNVASALCNAVLSNLAGIFVTPALLLRFFGTEVKLPFLQMVWKLCNKVLLPVAVGQALRLTKVKDFYQSHSKVFKRTQETILLSIVWNAFCNAFYEGLGLQFRHGVILVGLLPLLHLGSMFGLKKLLEGPFLKKKFTRQEVVAAMFCASQKTLAFGLPLLNTIFEGNPNLAAYCAPIVFVHPLQLIFGSLLVPIFSRHTSSSSSTGMKK